jgi:hypothetical protein
MMINKLMKYLGIALALILIVFLILTYFTDFGLLFMKKG